MNELHIETSKCKKVFLGEFNFINENGNIIKRYVKKINEEHLEGLEIMIRTFEGYQINGCSLLIPKTAFEECGDFAPELRYMQDIDMWYRIMLKDYTFIYTDESITYNRVHSNQATVKLKNIGQNDREIIGNRMIEELNNKYYANKNLLLYYTIFCMRKNCDTVGKKAVQYLKENRQINKIDFIKINISRLYGKIRPAMVRFYYRLAFKIRIVKH